MAEIGADKISKRFSVPVISSVRLSGQAFELRIDRPQDFEFMPGQWIRIFQYREDPGYLQDDTRDYTIISEPDDRFLSLCIQDTISGGFSSSLAESPPGSRVVFSGPHGYFTFTPSRRPAVCVATGTGIAPFVAYSRHKYVVYLLLHGVSRASELYYRSELKEFAIHYVPCITEETVQKALDPETFHGRVTSYLANHLCAGAYDFYLCGSSGMIRDAMHLIDDRFPDSRVYTEHFY